MAQITQLSQLDLSKTYTLGDYFNWKFEEMVELIKGKIYKMSPAPVNSHQKVSWNLSYEIAKIIKKNKCSAYFAPFDVYLFGIDESNTTVTQPDICVICDKSKIHNKGCVGAPDWIVEILSPSTLRRDIDSKYHLYEEAGVKEYWIIAPEYKQVSVFVLSKDNIYENKGDFSLNENAPIHIWQGISISVNEIFEDVN
ncbi:MAG: Uma2 family endonuclease [Bacteroidota bacterium]|nr:Uma2 family endonuclease [Bacteroidota bacterium]